jgi:hypothetical protein
MGSTDPGAVAGGAIAHPELEESLAGDEKRGTTCSSAYCRKAPISGRPELPCERLATSPNGEGHKATWLPFML